MRIVFCGVGALGSTAAVLCRNLDATLCFVDFDRVESKNVLVLAFADPTAKKLVTWVRLRNGYGEAAEYRAFLKDNPLWPER